MNKLVRRAALFAAGVALIAPAVQAQTINVSTGVSASGVPLADGSADPFWTISSQGGPFGSAVVMFPVGMCCGMENADFTRAKWITDITSPSSPSTNFGINPTAVLRRQFDLSGYDLSTVQLSGNWRFADYFVNQSQGFFLNGTRLFGPAGPIDNWSLDHAFSGAGVGAFVAGVNTLEVRGVSVNSTWDGLYLDAAVTGRIAAVPEPAALALFATGAALLAGIARRRRAS